MVLEVFSILENLALIMKHAAENKDFVRICQTPHHFYKNHPFSDGTEKWATNKNPLLKADSKYKYDYAYCGKTGYTIAANHSYTAVAKKGDQTIVGAFLNATDKDGFYKYVCTDCFIKMNVAYCDSCKEPYELPQGKIVKQGEICLCPTCQKRVDRAKNGQGDKK